MNVSLSAEVHARLKEEAESSGVSLGRLVTSRSVSLLSAFEIDRPVSEETRQELLNARVSLCGWLSEISGEEVGFSQVRTPQRPLSAEERAWLLEVVAELSESLSLVQGELSR